MIDQSELDRLKALADHARNIAAYGHTYGGRPIIIEFGRTIPLLIAEIERLWKERDAAATHANGATVETLVALDAAQVEIKRLQGVIERDRTKTAESIAALRGIVAGRSWLGEGRGNLAWDDDKYQEEFRGMIDEFMAALDPLKALAADWSDCPKDFHAARIDWKARAEKAEADRDKLRAALTTIRDRNTTWTTGEGHAAAIATARAALSKTEDKS